MSTSSDARLTDQAISKQSGGEKATLGRGIFMNLSFEKSKLYVVPRIEPSVMIAVLGHSIVKLKVPSMLSISTGYCIDDTEKAILCKPMSRSVAIELSYFTITGPVAG